MVEAQGNAQEPCSGDGLYNPTPTAIEVGAVPIVVESTTVEYFVLYVRHEVGGTTVEIPVLVKRGDAGTTTLAENVAALPKERYRVEKFLIADPADVDGDCIDDITELADPLGMNPVNPAAAIKLRNGTVVLPDPATFEALARDNGGRLYLKFVLLGMDTDRPSIYILNTKTHPEHYTFMNAVGIELEVGTDRQITGEIIYDPELIAPNGSMEIYFYRLNDRFPFSFMARSFTVLSASIPLFEDNLALYVPNWRLPYL